MVKTTEELQKELAEWRKCRKDSNNSKVRRQIIRSEITKLKAELSLRSRFGFTLDPNECSGNSSPFSVNGQQNSPKYKQKLIETEEISTPISTPISGMDYCTDEDSGENTQPVLTKKFKQTRIAFPTIKKVLPSKATSTAVDTDETSERNGKPSEELSSKKKEITNALCPSSSIPENQNVNKKNNKAKKATGRKNKSVAQNSSILMDVTGSLSAAAIASKKPPRKRQKKIPAHLCLIPSAINLDDQACDNNGTPVLNENFDLDKWVESVLG